MSKSTIYKITNLVNGKVYIGQTSKSIKVRWKTHKAKYTNPNMNILLYNSMKKHGIESFIIESLEQAEKRLSCEREKYYIALFESYFKLGKGYNMTLGGEDADTINSHPDIDIIKAKMSKSKVGAKNNRYGVKHNDKSKLKMSENHTDFKKENHPQAISFKFISPEGYIYTIKGEFKEFCRIKKLSHHVMRINVDKGVINNITHKRSIRHNGWQIDKLKNNGKKKYTFSK